MITRGETYISVTARAVAGLRSMEIHDVLQYELLWAHYDDIVDRNER